MDYNFYIISEVYCMSFQSNIQVQKKCIQNRNSIDSFCQKVSQSKIHDVSYIKSALILYSTLHITFNIIASQGYKSA